MKYLKVTFLLITEFHFIKKKLGKYYKKHTLSAAVSGRDSSMPSSRRLSALTSA
jgi:hypothetical protein